MTKNKNKQNNNKEKIPISVGFQSKCYFELKYHQRFSQKVDR